MMIVIVAGAQKQPNSVIDFSRTIRATDKTAEDYHIEIMAARCPSRDSKYDIDCADRRCPSEKKKPKRKRQTPVLKYVADDLTDCKLRFDWCDLLWSLPSQTYTAVLFEQGAPKGRFHIQLISANLYANDDTKQTTCEDSLI